MDIIAGTPYEHLDRSTILSQLDVVNLLTEYCNKVVNSCLKSERKETDDVIKVVIEKLGDVSETLINLIKSQAEKVTDIDLKIDTTCSYLEELLHNLKKGLYDTFSLIQHDMEHMMTKTNTSCKFCGLIFTTQEHLSNHTLTYHTINQTQLSLPYTDPRTGQVEQEDQARAHSSSYICTLCNEHFPSAGYLDTHMQRYHGDHGVFKCNICDHYFPSHHALTSHINSYHGTSTRHKCKTCGQAFSTEKDLDIHLSNVHVNTPDVSSSSGNFECEHCMHEFENFDDFCDHNASHHPGDHCCPCDVCEQTFSSQEALEVHLDSDHGLQQVDGPIQELSDLHSLPNQGSIRTKTFELNRSKQVTEIRKDARIPDFEINVNNSDENCTIKCSSGFYIQVAQSCFMTLNESTVFNVSGIAITISDIIKTNDKNGSEVNRLIHFTFTSEHQGCGGVAVHLHHSTRNIQVQGSHQMPDRSKAALWFVDNVVVKRFKEQAKIKKFAIKNFNDSVQRTSSGSGIVPNTSNSNACKDCNILFNSRSKPSICSYCSQYLHKSCLKDHTRSCSKIPTIVSSLSTSSSSTTTTPVCAPPVSTSWPASASSSSTPSVPPSVPRPAVQVVPGVPPVIPGLKTVVTFVPPASVQSSSSPPSPPLVPVQTTTVNNKNGKRKTTKAVPVSSNETNVQFLQKELAAAQARIVQLDAMIVDKEQQAEILLSRVKILEEQQNKQVFDKYFPSNPPNPSKDQITAPNCSSNLVHHCPAQPCCQILRSCCTHYNHHPHGQSSSGFPCQGSHQPTPDKTQLSYRFEQHAERITEEINRIKAVLKHVQLDKSNNNQAQPMNHSDNTDSHQSSSECPEQEHQRPASVISVTSVEEFISDDPLNNSPLNL